MNDGGFGHDNDDVIFRPEKPRRLPNDTSVSSTFSLGGSINLAWVVDQLGGSKNILAGDI